MTSQVIAKRDPLEKVGNVVDVDGRLMVIEYSDLPDDVARKTNPDGSLAIWAGSIAVHVFDLDFLRRAKDQADSLPYHFAHKKVAYIDDHVGAGRRVEPAKANAIKFERFIFDLMPSARNAIVVEVDPASAFAPLKNASGAAADTPESVKAQISDLHRQWLREAGVEVADGIAVEISPCVRLGRRRVARQGASGVEDHRADVSVIVSRWGLSRFQAEFPIQPTRPWTGAELCIMFGVELPLLSTRNMQHRRGTPGIF